MYELTIIGAGPAGMTAAVYAARKKIKTLLVSQDVGGQAIWASKVENYMGYQFIEGAELMRKFEDQVKLFPLDQVIGEEVIALARSDGAFEMRTAGGQTHQVHRRRKLRLGLAIGFLGPQRGRSQDDCKYNTTFHDTSL